MKINGFNKTTLLDYPNHLAATIFLGGCNYRCPFCHNASLVLSPDKEPTFAEDDILSHLKKRSHIIEGVCITGGEPTLQKDLPEFIYKIKSLGLKVKLDTNGSNPTMLKSLLDNNLLDYISMDIKNAEDKYSTTIGISNFDTYDICSCVEIIMNSTINYEFRTTVVRELHDRQDFINIGTWIKGALAYYLQPYKDSKNVIKKGFTSYSDEELNEFRNLLSSFIPKVEIRGA